MKIYQFIILALLLVLAACGGGNGGGGNRTNFGQNLEEQEAEGSYRAILRPMNNSLSGYLPTGAAEVKVEADTIQVKTLMDDDARVPHMQSIQLGTRCPNSSDDRNGDGIVDINEAYAVTGGVFVPLDADINSYEEGAGIYPVGRGFTYVENASLSRLEEEVRSRSGQNLNLAGRVVLVHGVSGGTKMPETVTSNEGKLKQVTVPIACGILRRF